MKKLLIILLVLVYGLSSTGATVHLHFCCGKLDKVSLSTEHKKDCPQKGTASKRCCDNKQVDLKIKADQEPGAKWIALHQSVEAPLFTASYLFVAPLAVVTEGVFTTGPPVRKADLPLYIQHCVYRI